MAEPESLFDIFGDHTRKGLKNVVRQPLQKFNDENIGKTVSSGLVKLNLPNEPLKKGSEPKKSFFSNTGKALQLPLTPMQRPLSPKNKNGSLSKAFTSQVIYSDVSPEDDCFYEELEFTKPSYNFDNYHTDLMDYFILQPEVLEEQCCPTTPPPQTHTRTMELNDSYEDDFFTDDFSNVGHVYEDALELPEIY